MKYAFRNFLMISLGCLLLAPGTQAQDAKKIAPWMVVRDASALTMTVIKDGGTPVKGTLNFQQGTVYPAAPQNFVNLEIDMSSWDSALELRDTRVKSVFFAINGDKNRIATFKIPGLDATALESLQKTKLIESFEVVGQLTFNGVTVDVPAKLKVTQDPLNRYRVQSLEPVQVKISDLKLKENLDLLMQVCSHKSIDDVVKIDVALVLDASGKSAK